MKHSLIILSFLLLSSFLTSCDKTEETLYRWSKYPDYLWKGFRLLFFGDKETHPTYEGEVKFLSGIFGDYRIIQRPKHHIQDSEQEKT